MPIFKKNIFRGNNWRKIIPIYLRQKTYFTPKSSFYAKMLVLRQMFLTKQCDKLSRVTLVLHQNLALLKVFYNSQLWKAKTYSKRKTYSTEIFGDIVLHNKMTRAVQKMR